MRYRYIEYDYINNNYSIDIEVEAQTEDELRLKLSNILEIRNGKLHWSGKSGHGSYWILNDSYSIPIHKRKIVRHGRIEVLK